MSTRIAHIITSLGSGGSEQMLTRVVTQLQIEGINNTVIVLKASSFLDEELRAAGVEVVHLNLNRNFSSLFRLWQLRKILKEGRFQIVQTWLYHADLLGTLAWLTLRKRPTLFWNIRCSYMDFSQYSFLTRWIVWLLARLSPLPKKVLFNSDQGKIVHQKLGYHPREWTYVPNGFDLKKFTPNESTRNKLREEWNTAPNVFVIGHIARFDPMKDHKTFFEAAGILKRREKRFQLLLAGREVTKSNTTLQKLIADAHVENETILLGERKDVESLLNGLDLFCLSSIGEGFPNVIGEAMATGIPVVSTDVGESAKLIKNSAQVVPTRNPEQLANAIEQIMNLPSGDRDRLKHLGRMHIETNFGLQEIVLQYRSLYKQD